MQFSGNKYLFALFALFVLFADELFFGFVSITGMGLESGMKSREAIVIAGIAYVLLFWEMVNNRLTRRNYWQLGALLVVLVLFFSTRFFFPHDKMYLGYTAHFLAFGALCIPACYVGMRLARGQNNEQVLKMLPVFVIVVSLIVVVAVVSVALKGEILKDKYVFNYQSASYYLSFCYSYCFFYVFLYKRKSKTLFSKIENIGMLVMLFLCAIGCLFGGGRGAFVYLILISAFIVLRILSEKGQAKGGTVILLILAAAALAVLAMQVHVFDSVGFSRVTAFLTKDTNRLKLWNKAMQGFYSSPIFGHGLGSVWWMVGFYSHNLLADFLVETGVVGTLILVFALVRTGFILYKRSTYSSFDMFMLLVFMGAIMEYSLSGYWLSAPKLFLAFGYVFSLVAGGTERRPEQIVNEKIEYS